VNLLGTGKLGQQQPGGNALPRYRGSIQVTLSAVVSMNGIKPDVPPGRLHHNR
jgi:hypothetical protein